MFCVIVVALANENTNRLSLYKTGCAEIDGFELHTFELFLDRNLGPVLSCLTVMIWSLCVQKDLMHISDFVLAMWTLPRGAKSSYSVHPSTRRISILSISYWRLTW